MNIYARSHLASKKETPQMPVIATDGTFGASVSLFVREGGGTGQPIVEVLPRYTDSVVSETSGKWQGGLGAGEHPSRRETSAGPPSGPSRAFLLPTEEALVPEAKCTSHVSFRGSTD